MHSVNTISIYSRKKNMTTAEKWSLSVIIDGIEKQVTKELLSSQNEAELKLLQRAYQQVNGLASTVSELQKIGDVK